MSFQDVARKQQAYTKDPVGSLLSETKDSLKRLRAYLQEIERLNVTSAKQKRTQECTVLVRHLKKLLANLSEQTTTEEERSSVSLSSSPENEEQQALGYLWTRFRSFIISSASTTTTTTATSSSSSSTEDSSTAETSTSASESTRAEVQSLFNEFVLLCQQFDTMMVSEINSELHQPVDSPVVTPVGRHQPLVQSQEQQQQQLELQQQQQQQQLLEAERRQAEIIVQNETNIELRQLYAQLTELRELFHDMSSTVGSAQEDLDSIEANINQAQENVHEATEELSEAAKWKQRIRGIAFPAVGALIGGLIAGPVGFVAGIKGGAIVAVAAVGVASGAGVGTGISKISDHITKRNQQEWNEAKEGKKEE